MNIYQTFNNISLSNRKGLAILIDPDELPLKEEFDNMLMQIIKNKVDYIFVGGSLNCKKQLRGYYKIHQS